jgi:spore maturation protein CgeB
MTIVVFGLTISSAWGNGHATLWRGLCRALGNLGHRVVFFERDVPYYAAHRDVVDPQGCELVLYTDWSTIRARARLAIEQADVAMVTSYCPDGRDASALLLDSRVGVKVFYDLDTPVTLERLAQGQTVPYLPVDGLGGFDLVLSYTGGRALDELKRTLGARAVAPLYGSVDPDQHRPVGADSSLRSDLSYLGTYAPDRQDALQRLFIDPARCRPSLRFAIAGSQYPDDFPWESNIFYFSHMPPPMHPAFYCSSGLTLNVTRGPMAAMGFCPSGRLFEAAACGAPLLSDWWEGLDEFFQPGEEIFIADTTQAVLEALDTSQESRAHVAGAARERALACHSARARAQELIGLLDSGVPTIPMDAHRTRNSRRQEVV